MAAIVRRWKRFVAISCSHGHLVDQDAFDAVSAFADRYKAVERIHLGDLVDTAAFRSGAHGTPDEAESLQPDLAAGIRHLKQFRPTRFLIGNHDARLWESMFHPNAIRAHAARCMVEEIRKTAGKLKCQLVEHYDIQRSWVQLGDTKFAHGWMYGENAIRDHAETFGKIVFGHLHTVGMASGRTIGAPQGYCVGALARFDALTYAHRRRATLRWGQGLAYGEYCDNECVVSLLERARSGEWRFPV